MWFEQLMGFREQSPENVRKNINVEGDTLISKINGKSYVYGTLEIPTLAELKESVPLIESFRGNIRVQEVVADVEMLHKEIDNKNALFQAASQFNLLEMVGPHVTPESGVDRYENDYTQGPACAIACGAGTIYRNYFVEHNNHIGQSRDHQIDCLDLIGKELENNQLHLWKMQNGYAMINQEGLLTINKKIAKLDNQEREDLKEKLKVGIQWNTEVTKASTKHKVSQIYCSALPVAYSQIERIYWESFARVILEATYEATLYAALINLEKNKSNLVYLTLVGGGAFGNDTHWILESMTQAIRKFKNTPLDIKIVSYGSSNARLQNCINEL